MKPLPPPEDRAEDYRRALVAEPRLRKIETLVATLIELIRPDDTACYACIWEALVKPLVSDVLGWERGYEPKTVDEEELDRRLDSGGWVAVNLAKWLDEHDRRRRVPATGPTEEWLRSSDAFDLVTDHWLRHLEAADPANGHGIQCGARKR